MARNTRTLAETPSSWAPSSRSLSAEASLVFRRFSCRREKPAITLLEAVTCSLAFSSSRRQSSRSFPACSSRSDPADRSPSSSSRRVWAVFRFSSMARTSASQPAMSAVRADSRVRSSRNCRLRPWAEAVISLSFCWEAWMAWRISRRSRSICSTRWAVWAIWLSMPPDRSSWPRISSSMRAIF